MKEGKGTVSTESGVLSNAQYSFSTRFENGRGTNPEELIAAAHAGCYSMALSVQLGNAGVTPESLETTASVTLEKLDSGFTVTKVHLDLTARIHQDFRFDSRVTNVRTTTEEVFRKRRGVCQDFAHFQIACLRSLNMSARYVSGYLRTHPPPGQPRLVGADASHAWMSAYCPGIGWIDFDPTNNVVPSNGHVTIAWGRGYGDVSPLHGLIQGGGVHDLSVSVDVEAVES